MDSNLLTTGVASRPSLPPPPADLDRMVYPIPTAFTSYHQPLECHQPTGTSGSGIAASASPPQGATSLLPDQPSPGPPVRISAAQQPGVSRGMWECGVCERHMPHQARDNHLRGKPHGRQQLKWDVQKRQEEERRRDQIWREDQKRKNEDEERRKVENMRLEKMLVAAEIRMKEAKRIEDEKRKQAEEQLIPGSSACAIKKQPLLPSPESVTLVRKEAGTKQGLWECEVCEKSIVRRARKSHLAGKPHGKKLVRWEAQRQEERRERGRDEAMRMAQITIAEEKRKKEEERLRMEESQREQIRAGDEERKRADEERRRENIRVEAERVKVELEKRRVEELQREKIRVEDEKRKKDEEEWSRVEELRIREEKRQNDLKRIEEEERMKELKRIEEEKWQRELKRIEDEKHQKELKRIKEEKRMKELKRIEEEKRMKELKRIEEEKLQKELKIIEEEKRKKELKRIEDEKHQKELKRIEDEKHRKELKRIEEEKYQKEQKRIEEEKHQKELKRIKEEEKRQRELKRIEDKQKKELKRRQKELNRIEEEKRKKELKNMHKELNRIEEEKRKKELNRIEEEKQKQELKHIEKVRLDLENQEKGTIKEEEEEEVRKAEQKRMEERSKQEEEFKKQELHREREPEQVKQITEQGENCRREEGEPRKRGVDDRLVHEQEELIRQAELHSIAPGHGASEHSTYGYVHWTSAGSSIHPTGLVQQGGESVQNRGQSAGEGLAFQTKMLEYLLAQEMRRQQMLNNPMGTIPIPITSIADLPPLLYRVYDHTSVSKYSWQGFDAASRRMPQDVLHFKSMVQQHANWNSNEGTPFISVTSSPDAVRWHVANKQAGGKASTPMVAMIDTAALLGPCSVNVWKMHDAMDHLGLESWNCNRRAFDNEYICGLRVPAQAIFACCHPDYFMDIALLFFKNLGEKAHEQGQTALIPGYL